MNHDQIRESVLRNFGGRLSTLKKRKRHPLFAVSLRAAEHHEEPVTDTLGKRVPVDPCPVGGVSLFVDTKPGAAYPHECGYVTLDGNTASWVSHTYPPETGYSVVFERYTQ